MGRLCVVGVVGGLILRPSWCPFAGCWGGRCLSSRAIAPVVGASQRTVSNDLSEQSCSDAPRTVKSLDGITVLGCCKHCAQQCRDRDRDRDIYTRIASERARAFTRPARTAWNYDIV